MALDEDIDMDRDKSPLPKGPTKPHFVYIPRKPLLISILVVALGQLILSASTLGLRVRAKNFREETQRFPRLRILYPDGLLPVDDDPPGAFFTQTDELFFASTALCLTSSVVVAMLVVYSFIRGPFKAIALHRRFLAAFLAISCIFSLAVFLYISIIHGLSAQFDPDNNKVVPLNPPPPCIPGSACPPPDIRLGIYGTFDFETWFCQAGAYPHYNGSLASWPYRKGDTRDYRDQCTLQMASRWTLFPVFLFSAALGFLYYVDWRNDKVLLRTWKTRSADRDYV